MSPQLQGVFSGCPLGRSSSEGSTCYEFCTDLSFQIYTDWRTRNISELVQPQIKQTKAENSVQKS